MNTLCRESLMNEEEALSIIENMRTNYVSMNLPDEIVLDGDFSVRQLEAILLIAKLKYPDGLAT